MERRRLTRLIKALLMVEESCATNRDLPRRDLAALRDIRLRLEIARAKMINKGKSDGPVFTSGDDAVAYMKRRSK